MFSHSKPADIMNIRGVYEQAKRSIQ